jgi:predicted RND superfamily exporter protein
VLAGFALLAAASAGALTRLGADADFVHALPADDPVRLAHARLDREVTGVLGLDLLIAPGHRPGADDLARLKAVEDELRRDPGIAYCVSVADLVAHIGARARAAGQPADPAETLADLPLGAPKAWAQLVGPGLDGGSDGALRIAARQHDASVAANAAAARRAVAAAQRAFPGATVLAASGGLLLDETSQRMIPAVVRSLLLPLPVLVALLLAFLRSPRLALLALPVAGLPLVLTYATLPVLGWPVDIGVSMIACIALGIIIDDAARTLMAIGRRGDAVAAIAAVGPVLLGACLAMAGSFLACLAGRFEYTRHFGILLAAAFLIGLVVNLTLTPALGSWLRKASDVRRPMSDAP